MFRLYLFYIKAEDVYRQADRLFARCSTTVTLMTIHCHLILGQGSNLAHPAAQAGGRGLTLHLRGRQPTLMALLPLAV
jgi:hypothetical protein